MKKDKYTLPKEVIKAVRDALNEKVVVTPKEIVEWMKKADLALNGTSNDAEHDVLYGLREWLSEIYEDPARRI